MRIYQVRSFGDFVCGVGDDRFDATLADLPVLKR